MSSLRDQQKEIVRLLYLQHGNFKTASELSGVDYAVCRQWAVRGKWKPSQPVTSPAKVAADNVETELQEHERETRLSLSRSARRLAKDSESVNLRDADKVYTVAKTAAIVHKWDAKTTQANVMVNIALLGVDPSSVKVDSGDAAAHTIDLPTDPGTNET